MKYFAEMNEHENKMLNIWLQYCTDVEEGYADEDIDFVEYLKGEIAWYEEEGMEIDAKEYRQCLTEWTA